MLMTKEVCRQLAQYVTMLRLDILRGQKMEKRAYQENTLMILNIPDLLYLTFIS